MNVNLWGVLVWMNGNCPTVTYLTSVPRLLMWSSFNRSLFKDIRLNWSKSSKFGVDIPATSDTVWKRTEQKLIIIYFHSKWDKLLLLLYWVFGAKLTKMADIRTDDWISTKSNQSIVLIGRLNSKYLTIYHITIKTFKPRKLISPKPITTLLLK